MLLQLSPDASSMTGGVHIQTGTQNGRYFGRRLWSVRQAAEEAGEHGLHAANLSDLPEAHALCESLMGVRLAPLWALASAHAHTRGSAWIYREGEQITGTWLCLPLTWDGEASLRNNRFAYATPRLDELCEPGQEISGIYMWFAGGATRDSRRAIMRASASWFAGILNGVRVYGRAASDDGARALATFSFIPLDPARSDLFIRSPDREASA